GTLVVAGGYHAGQGILSTTESAHIQDDGTLSPWTPGTAMATPRYHLSAVSIGDAALAIGGYNDGQSRAWLSIEESEIGVDGAGPWVEPPAMHEPRSSLAATASGAHVYVSGGTAGLYGAWELITDSVESASLRPALDALGTGHLWVGLRNSDD